MFINGAAGALHRETSNWNHKWNDITFLGSFAAAAQHTWPSRHSPRIFAMPTEHLSALAGLQLPDPDPQSPANRGRDQAPRPPLSSHNMRARGAPACPLPMAVPDSTCQAALRGPRSPLKAGAPSAPAIGIGALPILSAAVYRRNGLGRGS